MSLDVDKLNAWIKEDPEMPVTRADLGLIFQAFVDLENLTDVLFDRLAVVAMFAMGPSESPLVQGIADSEQRALRHQTNRALAEAAIVSLCGIDRLEGKRRGSMASLAKRFGIDVSGPPIEKLTRQVDRG